MKKKAKRPKISLVKRGKTYVSEHKTPLIGSALVLMFVWAYILLSQVTFSTLMPIKSLI